VRSSGRGRVRREAKKRKGKERGWKEEREKGKKRGEFRPMVVFKSRRHDCISTFSRHLFTTLCDVLCERNWWLMCSSLLRIAGFFSQLHSAKPRCCHEYRAIVRYEFAVFAPKESSKGRPMNSYKNRKQCRLMWS